MNKIEMELVGDRVAITLRPRVKLWTKTRKITLPSALELSCLLLRSGALHHTVTVKGDPEMIVQVQGGIEEHAWLVIRDWERKGDPDLIACVSGEAVNEIGRCLHDLYLSATNLTAMSPERSIYVRTVDDYYLDGDAGEQSLAEVHPRGPHLGSAPSTGSRCR